MSLTLVLGGTRSGKSRRAENLAAASGRRVRYVATADVSDPAMADRIVAHAARRPASWTTVRAEDQLTAALDPDETSCVLVEGLGAWVAGVLHRAGAFSPPTVTDGVERARAIVMAEIAKLACAGRGRQPVIVVAEEAGHGVLPADAASRAWIDLLGDASQVLAQAAERVELVVAGRTLVLHEPAPGLPEPREHGDSEVRDGDSDHAVNVLAGGPPRWLAEELQLALTEGASRYPDERAAVHALADLHGRQPGEIVPTNGATQAIWLLPAALRPDLAVCVQPAFAEAEAALRAHGIPVVHVHRHPDRGFALDPEAVPAEADLVVVGNPASPSGTLDPAAALLALRRPGRVLVVDEAFMDMVPGEAESLVAEALDDVIVLRSATKSLSIPGLRAGYAVAPKRLADRLRAVRPPWSTNALALSALASMALRPEVLREAAARAEQERDDLARRLAALPRLRTWPASANFCLIEVPDGPAVSSALRAEKIAVRRADSFVGLGPGFLRLTARGPQENARLVAALAAVLASP